MSIARQISRQLCRRCSKSLSHQRPFHNVAEAQEYETLLIPLAPPDKRTRTDHSHFPYLTSLLDLDINQTFSKITSISEKTALLHILLTQPFEQRSWIELKQVVAEVVRENPDNTAGVLAGIFTSFSISDNCRNKGKVPAAKVKEQQEIRRAQLENFPFSSNLERIALAYYWIRNNRVDIATSSLQNLRITDELECFLVMKALMLFPLPISFCRWILKDVIKTQDIPHLAVKLALFKPNKLAVVLELLLQKDTAASDRITDFVRQLASVRSNVDVYQLLKQMKVPDEELKQVCLNLYHGGFDQEFYTTFLALSKSATLDIIPLVSGQHSASPPSAHILHSILAFVRLGVPGLISILINKVTHKEFYSIVSGKVTKDEWVLRVLQLEGITFSPSDYDALITPLSSNLRAKIIKRCCDDNTHPGFVQQVILNSYEDDTLNDVLTSLLKQTKNLLAFHYIDDCLLKTFPSLSGGKILSIVRYLADHSLLNFYQQQFWIIVGYDRRENGGDFVQNIMDELYPHEGVIYFSEVDLINLSQLVSSEEIKEILHKKRDEVYKRVVRFEEDVLFTKSTPRLLLGAASGSTTQQLLEEKQLLYRVAETFGIHSTVAMLQGMTTIGKNSQELVHFLKQIEENQDYNMFLSFMKFYGFLLPPGVKNYAQNVLKHQKKYYNSDYEAVTEMQLYLYSYLHQKLPLTEEMTNMLLQKTKERDIAHMLMVLQVLYPENDSSFGPSVMSVLELQKFRQHLSKKDKKLLLHLSVQQKKTEVNSDDNKDDSLQNKDGL